MKSIGVLSVAFAAVLMSYAMVQAKDERPPTEAERANIGRALKEAGFQSWGKIELDDGKWEVERARRADDRAYEVHLRPVTLEVIKVKQDD